MTLEEWKVGDVVTVPPVELMTVMKPPDAEGRVECAWSRGASSFRAWLPSFMLVRALGVGDVVTVTWPDGTTSESEILAREVEDGKVILQARHGDSGQVLWCSPRWCVRRQIEAGARAGANETAVREPAARNIGAGGVQ